MYDILCYMKKITYLTSALIGILVLVGADISSIKGLENGDAELLYTNSTTQVLDVFPVTTTNVTYTKKLNASFAAALRHDGKKIALVQSGGQYTITDIPGNTTYTSAQIASKKFYGKHVVVVVAKKKRTIAIGVFVKSGKRLRLRDSEVVTDRNIEPSKTILKAASKQLLLKNSNNTTRAQFTITDDFELMRKNNPVSCNDGWFETHAHLEEADGIEEYVERLHDNNIGCSLIFVGQDFDEQEAGDYEENYAETIELVKHNPGRFVPFFNGDPDTITDISTDNLQALLDVDTKNIYKGIGEYAFYQEPLLGTSLTTEPWPSVFAWAAEHDLVIMIHLVSTQADELDEMLTQYPNTQILLHGSELLDELPALLAEHENLWLTLDTANLLVVPGELRQVIMFPVQGGEEDELSDSERAEEFVELYDANETSMLTTAEADWAPVFEAAPDRILWGTDVAFSWHFTSRVYSRLISFSEQFLERLELEDQANYRKNNAKILLGDGKTL